MEKLREKPCTMKISIEIRQAWFLAEFVMKYQNIFADLNYEPHPLFLPNFLSHQFNST